MVHKTDCKHCTLYSDSNLMTLPNLISGSRNTGLTTMTTIATTTTTTTTIVTPAKHIKKTEMDWMDSTRGLSKNASARVIRNIWISATKDCVSGANVCHLLN
jgi:hypothetical protein